MKKSHDVTRRGRVFAAAVLLMVLCIFAVPAVAEDEVPSLPMQVFGTAVDKAGNGMPAGTEITAVSDDIVSTYVIKETGLIGKEGTFGEKFLIYGDTNENAVTFSAAGSPATETTLFASGELIELNLIFDTIVAPGKYTVTFNKNGGDTEANPSSIDETYGSKYVLPTTNPTKSGYTFAGWYTAAEGGEQVTAETVVNTAAKHTLYAKWTAKSYTIYFNGNGGTVGKSTLPTRYGDIVDLSGVTATRNDYIHIGWAHSPASTVAVYAPTEKVQDLGDSTLYAVWKQIDKAYDFTVIVKSGNNPVSGANVELKQGNAVLDSKTSGSDGKVTFSKVPEGAYTIAASSGKKTITKSVKVNKDEKEKIINFPAKDVSSGVDVKSGTPAVAIDGVDTLADAQDVESGKFVTVTVIVEAKTKESVAPEDTEIKEEIKAIEDIASAGSTLQYLEITIEKSVDDGTKTEIPTTTNVLEFIIPYDFTNKKNIKLYRCHEGTAEPLNELSKIYAANERNIEGFYLDTANNLIYLYAKQFSTYSIGYVQNESSPQQTPTQPSSPSSGKSEESTVWSEITETTTVYPGYVPSSEPTSEPTVVPPQDVPIISPVNQPRQETSTPAPFIGILAGLGAAGLLFTLRRK